MSKLIDLTGQRFGRLTVIERAENKGEQTAWRCKCDCGKIVDVRGGNLKSGHTTSCGCYWSEVVPQINHELNYRHGLTQTKLNRAWANMRYRCNNPNCKSYKNYGGRGISICEEWDVFENFMEWSLKNGFCEGASLDRIDNNGNYEPSNCRWVSMKTQGNNRRTNHFVTYKGETHTIKEWSEITGIKWSTIKERLKKGWTTEDALTKPIQQKNKGIR